MTEPAIIDTSVTAYEAVKPKVPSIRARVLQVIEDHNGIGGVSRTQIATMLDINEITAGSRITELLQSGKIQRTGETARSTNGKPEHLYVLRQIGTEVPKKKALYKGTAEDVARLLRTLRVSEETLLAAFYWGAEEGGYDFWSAVHSELVNLDANA